MFWWGSQPQGLALLWLWGTDLCGFVMGCREQEKDSHHHQPPFPLAHFSWSLIRIRFDPKPWVLEPEEKEMLWDFHRKSGSFSIELLTNTPLLSEKKKYQAPVLSKPTHLIIPHAFSILEFICTYLVETGSSLVSYPPPAEVSGVFDISGSRIWLTLPNYWISNGNWNL